MSCSKLEGYFQSCVYLHNQYYRIYIQLFSILSTTCCWSKKNNRRSDPCAGHIMASVKKDLYPKSLPPLNPITGSFAKDSHEINSSIYSPSRVKSRSNKRGDSAEPSRSLTSNSMFTASQTTAPRDSMAAEPSMEYRSNSASAIPSGPRSSFDNAKPAALSPTAAAAHSNQPSKLRSSADSGDYSSAATSLGYRAGDDGYGAIGVSNTFTNPVFLLIIFFKLHTTV